VLLTGIPGNELYNDRAEQLCLAVHSSGIFESGSAKAAERLLEKIDELKDLIA
jgi:hypothetical protein